jgi:hypothetical protein
MIRGGYMPIGRGVIPHDLVHFATEAHFSIDDGFWGLLARGATFKRGTGGRQTRQGRALVAKNRAGLNAAEQWLAVPDNGTLTVHWPMSASTRAHVGSQQVP